MKQRLNILREFSIPLLLGVIAALVWANCGPESYHHFVHARLLGPLNVHFLSNDIFMVFFFGIAAAEITQSCLPGGDLNPPARAVNPLLATLGGVIGPAGIYLILNRIWGTPELANGWGIPTATDIAIAWLVGRVVFGRNHAAVSFLLLLAIADDAIGLAIIAVFYPDAHQPLEPVWLSLVGAGMGAAYGLRRAGVRNYWPYLGLGGTASWAGLYAAHLHPALALVFIIPFLPHPPKETKHLFEEDPWDFSTLARFEHEWKVIVDFGLFLFGLANAGVELSALGTGTWLVLASFLIGKGIGIFAGGWLGARWGFPLPDGMTGRHLALVATISGIGFTVSLFMAGEAFDDPRLMAEAKMGALLSLLLGLVAIAAGRVLGIVRRP